jgi:hypothetical protein
MCAESEARRSSGDVFSKELRVSPKQKAHERKFVGLILIRGRPCGIRTCDQRIKSAWPRAMRGFVYQ